MDKTTFLTFARYYLNLGLNLTYISLKNNEPNEPYISEIKGNFLKIISGTIPDKEHLNRISDFSQIKGLGISLENTSLLCIDIDYCFDEKVLNEVLKTLGLPYDYEWIIKTGSGFGYHVIVSLESESLKDAYFDINSLEDKELSRNFLEKNDSRIKHVKRKNKLINLLDFVKLLSIPEEKGHNSDIFEKETLNIISLRVNEKHIHSIEKIQFLNDKHSILPPSNHKSGGKYSFKSNQIPSSYPEKILNDKIVKFIYTFCIDQNTLLLLRGYVSTWRTTEFKKYYGDNLTLIIDFETTGLINNVNYLDLEKFPVILQVSWIITDGKDIILSESSLNSDVEDEIPEDIKSMTGIDKNLCKELGRPLSVITEMLINDLDKVNSIEAYNIDFDIECLKHLFFRTSNPFNIKEKNQICLMKKAFYYKNRFPGYDGEKWFPLEKLFKLIYPNTKLISHNSLSDVLMAYKISKLIYNFKYFKDNEDRNNELTKEQKINFEEDDLPF